MRKEIETSYKEGYANGYEDAVHEMTENLILALKDYVLPVHNNKINKEIRQYIVDLQIKMIQKNKEE